MSQAGPSVLEQVGMAIDRLVGRRDLLIGQNAIQGQIAVQIEEESFLVGHRATPLPFESGFRCLDCYAIRTAASAA